MQLRVLGCQGGSAPQRHLRGLLLDGTVLLEAGSVTSMATFELTSEPIWKRLGRRQGSRSRRAACAALALGTMLSTTHVAAQTTPPVPATEEKAADSAKGPNTGRLSISAGVDWMSAYFFRGIKQETEDLILQPYGELSLKLVDNAGALTSLSLTPGIWNSIHTGPTRRVSVWGSDASPKWSLGSWWGSAPPPASSTVCT